MDQQPASGDAPRTIGHYQVVGELGRGAMAIVYKAHDPELERDVAIKEPLLAPGTRPDDREAMLARFEVEAKAAARLSHPGVVAVYQTVRQEGDLYIVMELLAGMTLAQRRAAGHIPPEEAARIVWELACALAYAHSKGVVHRDIKPDNVFVLHDGHVKLGDFGVARLGLTSQFTHAGTVLGTPGYMSPEQVLGQPADARSDVFSLGVLFDTLLTGQNPFGADTGTEFSSVMYRIVHEDIPPTGAGTSRPDIPCAYEAIIRKATAKNPAYRYQTVSEMVADISGRRAPAQLPAEAMSYPGQQAAPAGTLISRGAPPPDPTRPLVAPGAQPAGTVVSAGAPGHAGTIPPVAAAPRRVGLWILVGIGGAIAALALVSAVAVGVYLWAPWKTAPGVTGPGGPGGPAGPGSPATITTVTPPGGQTQGGQTGGQTGGQQVDVQVAVKKSYVAKASAIQTGIEEVHAALRSNADRINNALGSSDSEVRAARDRLKVIAQKVARLRSRQPQDPTGSYAGIDDKLSRLLDLADTRVSSQQAICDAYLNGARGSTLESAGQPWGRQARVEFERVLGQLAQQLAAARAALR